MPKVRAKGGETRSEITALAQTLCTLYYDALRAALAGVHGHGVITMEKRNLDQIDGVARRQFRKAAEACAQVGADPREYIIAQFHRWAEVSALKNKVLVPQPGHLSSLGAQARYVQYKLRKTERESRRAPVVKADSSRKFFREERKLSGLVRMLRVMPEDVLTERPEEFTSEFLRHKQVWDLVKDRWHTVE